MTFYSLNIPYLKSILPVLIGLSLWACQEDRNKEITHMPLPEVEQEIRPLMPLPATFTADSIRRLNQHLDSIFEHYHETIGFNGTVLITKYDRVIYKGAFGYKDFSQKDTLTTQTAFQLASVSKQFTAMAVMMLQEQGKLSYDDSVQQYLPDFPFSGITIRQLLTHRSGLGNYTYFSDKLWPDRQKFMNNQDVLDLMQEHELPVYYQPNTHFDYSNTGYFLLATIVEKASGMPFASFLQKNIFKPLNMTHTFTFGDSVHADLEKVATGHTGSRRKRRPDFLDTVLGDKGIYSTVEDLYKWDQALYTEKLVKKETLREAFTGTREKKRDEDYGFGWRIRALNNGDTVVFHAGLWHGYNTYLLRNPSDHSALIVLSNVPNGSLRHIIDLEEILYPVEPSGSNQKSAKKNTASAAP